MARAESTTQQHALRTAEGIDDVEKSLEVLDKVLSEFEEETEGSPPTEPESPSQGHQSEDDGYMSMNGRRAKFVPDFQPTAEVQSQPVIKSTIQTSITSMTTTTTPTTTTSSPVEEGEANDDVRQDEQQNILSTSSLSPPSPEEAEKIILNLLPRISPTHTSTPPMAPQSGDETLNNTTGDCRKTQNISLGAILLPNGESGESKATSLVSNTVPEQTTLPKARPMTLAPDHRYASLPSTSPPRIADQFADSGIGGDTDSLGSGRNILGIGISAVHDAVIRGMAKMPETIVNEHPVTIYPGRSSPSRRVPPRTLPGSIERHREVCRQNYNDNSSSNNEKSSESSSSSSSHTSPEKHAFYIHQQKQQQNDKLPTPTTTKFDSNDIHLITFDQYPQKVGKRKSFENDEDRFSEDSLEESSLPPPPPPPVIPPPPSLSAPVTPSKRHSVAWEINLDDSASIGEPQPLTSNKQILRSRSGKLGSGSQSSINSTPGHSSTSAGNKKSGDSNDWPDPPDIPVCSTEDEANSIYSDSDGIHIPDIDQITGKPDGTYVIRKGRKQRQRLSDLDSINSSQYNSNDDILASNVPSPVFPASINIPKNRHSIDLGASCVMNKLPSSKQQRVLPNKVPVHSTSHHAALNSARSRLSLDLSHSSSKPGIVKPPQHFTIQFYTKPVNNSRIVKSKSNNSIISSSRRYTEFKTFDSAFDGLQAALEKTNNNNNNNNYNCGINKSTSNNNINNNGNSSGGGGGVVVVENNAASSGGNAGTTTTSILINCGGVVSNNGTPQTTVNSNSNISSVLLNSTGTEGMTPLSRSASLPIKVASAKSDDATTPRRDLAPPIEEDEEHSSLEIHERPPPLQEIENNISALLRGDLQMPRVIDVASQRRAGFRLGVHKSESAKEMLLQQPSLGPLPPSPPSCSPEPDSDEFPPLPPSPSDNIVHGMHGIRISSRGRLNNYHDEPPTIPPHVPPHRGPSINTLKTRSMDAGFSKSYRNGSHHQPPVPTHQPGTLPSDLPGSINSRRRVIPAGYPRRAAQSPTKEERRLQTSCSLPETPIFGRGCDIPRTPHRRAAPETPISSISRTAPRSNSTTLNSSVIGIGASALGSGRQRNLNQVLASSEMLRLAGGPARGWYPKQRQNRPSSAENLDKLHPQGSLRAWDTATSTGNTVKEKENKGRDYREGYMHHQSPSVGDDTRSKDSQKKKGFFRNFWKKSKHYSLDQHQ
ncbi:putative uncharacterized protein DDB_G0277255 isoform X2 [Culicoides brevitarsis]|uniref:putative uncharacterized protein DDB_G0277255 isoform X2 n=1 Tax=Culicoides brevitarsis TaxID=469753 RepID=UPI00307B83F9